MKNRIKKILSLLIAASMVLTMNTVAFGEETAAEEPVFEVLTDEKSASSNCYYWTAYEDPWMAKCFVGYSQGGESSPTLTAKSDHIVNGTPVAISENQGGGKSLAEYYGRYIAYAHNFYNDKDELTGFGAHFYDGVSSNVFKLDETHYLMVAYRLINSINLNANTRVPVVPFNGLHYLDVSKTAYKRGVDKNNCTIAVEASLVEQQAGKAPTIIANSLSSNASGKKPKPLISITVKPKNNIYANVSMNSLWNDDKWIGYPAIQNPYLKAGDHPFFTITLKLDSSLKNYTAALKTAVNQANETVAKAEFEFDICRNQFADAYFDTLSPNDINGDYHETRAYSSHIGFRHTYPNLEEDAYLNGTGMAAGHGQWMADRQIILHNYEKNDGQAIGSISLFTDAKKLGNKMPPVYLLNTLTNEEVKITGSRITKNRAFTSYKLKDGMDYKSSSLAGGCILLEPMGNFEGDGAIFRNVEYTVPAGFYDNYNHKTYAKDTTITEVRCGVYNEKTKNYYCDSVE